MEDNSVKKMLWGGYSPFLLELSKKSPRQVLSDIKRGSKLTGFPIVSSLAYWHDYAKNPSDKKLLNAMISTQGDIFTPFIATPLGAVAYGTYKSLPLANEIEEEKQKRAQTTSTIRKQSGGTIDYSKFYK